MNIDTSIMMPDVAVMTENIARNFEIFVSGCRISVSKARSKRDIRDFNAEMYIRFTIFINIFQRKKFI